MAQISAHQRLHSHQIHRTNHVYILTVIGQENWNCVRRNNALTMGREQTFSLLCSFCMILYMESFSKWRLSCSCPNLCLSFLHSLSPCMRAYNSRESALYAKYLFDHTVWLTCIHWSLIGQSANLLWNDSAGLFTWAAPHIWIQNCFFFVWTDRQIAYVSVPFDCGIIINQSGQTEYYHSMYAVFTIIDAMFTFC